MLTPQLHETIQQMHRKGIGIREITRLLGLSRNTVRRALRGEQRSSPKTSSYAQHLDLITELLARCRGNVVRVGQCLDQEYGIDIPYTTLTWIVRAYELRQPHKKRSGAYVFQPGEEMQHDTTPYRIALGSESLKAQCASLALAYSRKIFIQFYPRFTRFEAKVFLSRAFVFMQGLCPRCVVDNTSVIVSSGSGPSAIIAPEMEAFSRIFQTVFVPHRINDPNRKARVERPFDYVSKNFLAGRSFLDWDDLNAQAQDWCQNVANAKIKRSLGMSPEKAYLMEKPSLIPLPLHVPEVYRLEHRVVDSEGYVHLETHRYSVPEELVGHQVDVCMYWERVEVWAKSQKVAKHPRVRGSARTKVTDPSHHSPIVKIRKGPSQEERLLTGQNQLLDSYVAEIKKRSRGRAVQPLRRLLRLKRTYTDEPFLKAIEQALQYRMFDLGRLENIIISLVGEEFFDL